MTKNLKYFLIPLVLSFGFFWGVNFYYQGITINPNILTAQANQLVRHNNAVDLDITAQSAISLLINDLGEEKILFSKDADKKLPIASLTKLMTAKIILEKYDLDQLVRISEKASILPGNGAGKLKAGQVFKARDLFYLLLIESNNTAAYAMAEVIDVNEFVDLMNLEAANLGLASTNFANPTGLDDLQLYSTTEDLAKLTINLFGNKPLIWDILALQEFDLYSAEGNFLYKAENTNELLGKLPSIIGGKTGETPKAGGSFLLLLKAPKGKGYLINIILHSSDDRFKEMEKLINWLKNAYQW